MSMKRKRVDSGNVGQEKKVAMVGNRLDVGREKDSGETEITLGFPVGRSRIGRYFPQRRRAGPMGKMSSPGRAGELASANGGEL